ncbi:MAG: sensor histidine kinase [Spirochaetaceae bacterium]|jgi:two-component system sensor histidine kinase HydH|nr:sensor histidine kinase [Spirochaetaceae bacterium]
MNKRETKTLKIKTLPLKTLSLFVALLIWLVILVFMTYIGWSLRDRARLITAGENEMFFNIIQMQFFRMDSFSEVDELLESEPVFKERILGIGLYDSNLKDKYRWGTAPLTLDQDKINTGKSDKWNRWTSANSWNGAVKFIVRLGPRRNIPAPPAPPAPDSPPSPPPAPDSRQQRFQFSDNYFYMEVVHPIYQRTFILTTIFFPFIAILMLLLVLYTRRLFLRNHEYSEKLEAQKNLVVLGTAASTLAHEIKNPLSSIRLQTGILEKTCPAGNDEISAINEEIDRLSDMTYKVNDYLRDAKGRQEVINVKDLLEEVSRKLLGTNTVQTTCDSPLVYIDCERLRSVLENIIRNAMESGSKLDEVKAGIEKIDNKICVKIEDRGKGIAEENLSKIFDPFWTNKSRGTGIGLSVSKRFIEAAKGSIEIKNRQEGGVEVLITLPEVKV